MHDRTRAITTGVLLAAALALAWVLTGSLLTIFAGILVASLLDAIVRQLARVLPLPHAALVILVTLAVFGTVIAGLSLGGMQLWQSVDDLVSMLIEQARQIYLELRRMIISIGMVDNDQSLLADAMPDPAGLLAGMQTVFGSAVGAIANVVVIVFLGIFFALNPAGYRDGMLDLAPRHLQPRLRTALDAVGHTLRGWIVTQVIMMGVIGTLVGTLLWALGTPNALTLGVLAGALNFIPFLGPIISAVPVLLTLASQDMTTFLLGALGMLLIQNLEGYVLTPLMQQRVIHLPPAWSLCTMLIMGSLFGFFGVALATPAYAVIRTLTLRLYIEPRMGLED
ncbi:AI-2E family transporter [Devosia sp. PTR5]|uniref:AI-2E family transporter n=1 Tax=Devosia oryzisoli TaxID=2774138 RepID=A0A927FUC9_9HYPH|nr:AI-2E family transporter [Devosia oryzisoli]